MKDLTNSQVNYILLVKDGIDVSDSVVARLRQLGGSNDIDIPISDISEDCFTVTYELILGHNALKNGLYLLKILDSQDEVIFETCVRAHGNDSNIGYVILDNEEHEDYIYVPPAVTFSDGDITFSNDYDG